MRPVFTILVAVMVAACQSRPLNIATPEPVSDSVVVAAGMFAATDAARQALTDQGLPLRLIDREAGLVESEYADLVARLTQYDDLEDQDRFVRFRFQVKERDGYSTVIVQVLENPYYPRVFDRYHERAVGPHHPAREIGRDMLDDIANSFAVSVGG